MYLRKEIVNYLFLAAVAITGVRCSDDDETVKSADKSITAFKLAALTPAVTAIVNESARTIAVSVPSGTTVTALVPTVEVSEKATVTPASGTAQNFTTPVTYTVTAEDGTKQAYVVTVTVAESPSNEVTCYPTVLPIGEEILDVTYTADHKVATAAHREIGEDEIDYVSEYEYANGKISRVNYRYGNDITSYVTFTYGTSTIIESYYDDVNNDGVREKTHYYIYYLTGSRVNGWAYHSTGENQPRLDSAAFTMPTIT